jgi:PadR family transcriptional regulator, regulatory protein PadR
MKTEATPIEMRKGVLDLCTLHIIARGETPCSDMIDELVQADLLLVQGAIYPLLYKFKKAGLINARTIEQNGIPKKLYTITEKGTAFLAVMDKHWEELLQATNEIIAKNTTI